MECCAKLESFLEEQELISISETAKEKIAERFLNLNQLVTELRNENSELKVILESEEFKFEKEISASRQQLQQSTESCTKLKLQIADLEENLNSTQKQWRDLQKNHDSAMLELQSVKRENELLNQEKRNLTEQLEKRRNEIEKLNDDLKSLLDQVTAANEAKFEAIASAEESKLKESNLQHQVNRLEQEKELLNRQISDLNAELTQKNSEIHTLKREKSNSSLELKTLLEERADEIHMLQKRLDCYKELVEERDTRIEQLAEKIRQLNQSHAKAEEQFNLELNAQAKLIDLHKNASEENQKRVEELMRAFEEAQKLLKESNDSCEEMEKHCATVENKCKSQLEEKQAEIMKLKEEIRRVKDAARGLNQDAIEKIFPVAAATSKVLHSGITLTELYVEYTRLQEELQSQKSENANLTRELKQIIAEIEEKTPIINQRMQEYNKLNETISCLKSQLANALAVCLIIS
ncbi:Nucleoprotein TPR [Araneus ventricosus]|uniref:Nucleoprotein TPR n=1 Tax=Araneus ventricosus TaxID=182803 RepID=A0A4Y2FCM4_ARAVE|nr:Nucleoprotein TPR [Araneus ventricosus]